MMRHLKILVLVAAVLWFAFPAPARAGVVIGFDLQPPSISAATASFDVLLTFSGDPADTIEAFQLSVMGSDPLLTASDTDFSRFSFTLNTSGAPLAAWAATGTIGATGVELGFALDPLLGPFITPSPTAYDLGVLTVDLSGIAPGTDLMVTLAGGPPLLNTDAGGSFGGVLVPSAAADPSATVSFGQPGGATFSTIPEPGALALWTGLGIVGLLARARRGCKRSR